MTELNPNPKPEVPYISEVRLKQWKRTEAFLRAAIASLDEQPSTDLVHHFFEAEKFLTHNEFQLAWDVLRDAGRLNPTNASFVACMHAADRLMSGEKCP